MNSNVITRFAPSPTGFLHIGGARTALFNWLYTKSQNGKFLLRIEDTDTARSTIEATSVILKGLEWLGLSYDGDAVSQRSNFERHQEIADQLMRKDLAYRCYATKEDIINFQENSKIEGTSTIFKSPWRDKTKISNKSLNSVVRLRSSDRGKTEIIDKIKGNISWKNDALDDLILLRSDGTPTYMLAVVVDDHDMQVSHIIRGDDHLTNTARQIQIYKAMGWPVPEFAHIPLIYGADGAKLSKRHGAVSLLEYKKLGYPAEAVKNYLARLGWSHGDKEYFTMEEAIQWFSLEKVGKSPARFDQKKLDSVSKYHLNKMSSEEFLKRLIFFSSNTNNECLTDKHVSILKKNMGILRERSRTFKDAFENIHFLFLKRPLKLSEEDCDLLTAESLKMLQRLTLVLTDVTWTADNLETLLSSFVAKEGTRFQAVAQPLRLAVIGRKSSPNIATILSVIGKQETLDRISDVIDGSINSL